MYPVLFDLGPFVISSFGLMMVLAFLSCNYLLQNEVKACGYDEKIAEDITFRAAIGGIIGAKLYYLIETIPTGGAKDNIQGLIDIIAGIFTLSIDRLAFGIQNFGAGLVFLGGLMGGFISVSLYLKKNNIPWLKAADWIAPLLLIGHGIGRIGCFLVGDCYGLPTDLPWGCKFPNGLPPTHIPVHPTQLYEMLSYFFIYLYLRYRKTKQSFPGEIMYEYLFLAGLTRLLVEFIRTNSKYLFGLSGAQYISIFMMIIGTYFMWKNRKIINNE